MVKNPPVNIGDSRDTDSIPRSRRYPGIGNGNPLQYCCLENSVDRVALLATVRGVTKRQTWLSDGAEHTLLHEGAPATLSSCMLETWLVQTETYTPDFEDLLQNKEHKIYQ